MKKIVACVLLLPCLLPAAAEAKAGQLDRSFSHDGKASLLVTGPSSPGNEFVGLGWGGKGRVVVSVAQRLFEYLPDGSFNRNFGRNGQVEVVARGGKRPTLRAMAVDSRGRILVAGDRIGQVYVGRYLPDGEIDRSFGRRGWVITGLDLPAPIDPPSTVLEHPPIRIIASIRVTGLAIDAADRPVLTGAWLREFQGCESGGPQSAYSGLVARFEENGSSDSSFDSDGVRIDLDSHEDAAPAIDGDGIVFLGADFHCLQGGSPLPVLKRLLPDGALDESFGTQGQVELPYTTQPPAFVQDRFGSKLLAGAPEASLATLLRLRPDGTQDSSFGESDGTALLSLPEQVPTLAVDGRGRPLLATNEFHKGEGSRIEVRRLLADGRRDPSFGGRGGVASARFAGYASPDQVLVGGHGQILVAGRLSRSGSFGVALARFRGR